MICIKSLCVSLVLLAGILFAAPVAAASIAWTLAGVSFDDGATASGTFATDATTGGILSFDITTTDGDTLNGFHYLSSGHSFMADNLISPNSFLISADDGLKPYLNLAFDHSLTTLGVNSLRLGGLTTGSWECKNCIPVRTIVSGYAMTTPVPEPDAYAMLLSGLGLLGLVASRRRRVTARRSVEGCGE